jgi:hypothetical protein
MSVLDFKECDTCAAKPGSPILCEGCLHNRAIISEINRKNRIEGKLSAANLTPPPDNGDVALPNGCHLYWRLTEQGREYVSDEVGGGVMVWHTALVDPETLLAAVVQEAKFQRIEYEIQQIKLRG